MHFVTFYVDGAEGTGRTEVLAGTATNALGFVHCGNHYWLDYGYHAPTIYFPLLFHESLMIEPTENESKETIDGFIQVMRKIAQEAKENPELVKSAPHNTPIGRVDDVLAAKHPVVTFRQMKNEEQA